MNTMGILTSLSIFRMLVLRNKVSKVPKRLIKISPRVAGEQQLPVHEAVGRHHGLLHLGLECGAGYASSYWLGTVCT